MRSIELIEVLLSVSKDTLEYHDRDDEPIVDHLPYLIERNCSENDFVPIDIDLHRDDS